MHLKAPHIFMIICAGEDYQVMVEQIELALVGISSAILSSDSMIRCTILVDSYEVKLEFMHKMESLPLYVLK